MSPYKRFNYSVSVFEGLIVCVKEKTKGIHQLLRVIITGILSLPYLRYYDVGCSCHQLAGSAGHNQSLAAQRTEYSEAGGAAEGGGGGGRSACTSRES